MRGAGPARRRLSVRSPERAWSAAKPGNRAARRELLEAILAAAEPQLRGGGALLDCGCGTGWLLEALAAAGVRPERLHGVDADNGRVEAAARRVPGARVRVADARELPFPDAAFAAVFHVVSLSSMGAREDVQSVLTETRRVLAPGGAVLVYEPRWPNPLNRATRRIAAADLAAAGLPAAESRTLTLFPPLGRRLGPLTGVLHPRLSRLPPLRSHRLFAAERQGLSQRQRASARSPHHRGKRRS